VDGHQARYRRARQIMKDSAGYARNLNQQQVLDLMDSLAQRLSPITENDSHSMRIALQQEKEALVQANNSEDTPLPP